jgi:antitoxin MazE
MKSTIKKWGKSASVRIPAAVLQAAHMDIDDSVNVREEAGRIIIEPLQRKKVDLATLVKGITRKNVHREIDFGGHVRA